jgi:hypothetical protein
VSANRSVPPLFAATVQPFSRRRFFPASFPPHQYHRLTVTAGIREEEKKKRIQLKILPTKTKKAKQR